MARTDGKRSTSPAAETPTRWLAWRPPKGVEVDIDQPETVAETIGPLEVVPGAPQEVPATGTPSEVARWSCLKRARRNITRSESYTLPSSGTTSDRGAVPGDEDRQCVGPIGSQAPQLFVHLSELIRTAVRAWSASPDQLSDDAGRMVANTDQKVAAER
jgi:hypothetical protein